jgi:hypothetical protein
MYHRERFEFPAIEDLAGVNCGDLIGVDPPNIQTGACFLHPWFFFLVSAEIPEFNGQCTANTA